MIKQAPNLPRIAATVAFAMSCLGILLFLWLQFGGAIPLRPEAYNVEVAFPEATGLQKNLDVRASGITIGKVRDGAGRQAHQPDDRHARDRGRIRAAAAATCGRSCAPRPCWARRSSS